MPGGPYSALGFLFDHDASLSAVEADCLTRHKITIANLSVQVSFDPSTASRKGVDAYYLHAVQQLWRAIYTDDLVDGVIRE